jgi:hypothetical protein
MCAIAAMLMGCSSIGYKKIEMKTAPDAEKPWWQTPYHEDRDEDNPWDKFVPKEKKEVDDVEYFEKNIIRWPKQLKKPTEKKPEKSKPSLSEKFI